MSISINTPSVTVSASTTSATGTLPDSQAKYILVVNGSTTSPCYVKAGASGLSAATSANVAIPAFGQQIFERDPNVDKVVAVLLDSGTAKVSFAPVAQDSLG